MEAMDGGLPVVAAATEALAELFDDGVEDLLWQLDDPAQTTDIVNDLVEGETRMKATPGGPRPLHP